MFTLEQISTAHSKVKSGADFPAYISEIKQLGITTYETFVADGHTVFAGENDYRIISPAKYASLHIAEVGGDQDFLTDLKTHQEGKTDYLTFCRQAAAHGVEKWVVNLNGMTCTYLSKAGDVVLIEPIPQA